MRNIYTNKINDNKTGNSKGFVTGSTSSTSTTSATTTTTTVANITDDDDDDDFVDDEVKEKKWSIELIPQKDL
eukprot:Pgem_evm1s13008